MDQVLIEQARRSFPVYMTITHKTDMAGQHAGLALPAAHHLEMMKLLTAPDAGKEPVPDKEWAKRIRFIYLSHAATKAYQVSLAIKQTIEENLVYQAIFPQVKPDPKKWSEPEWRLKGNTGGAHANFTAGGIDSPPLGGRGDRIVLDDVGDEENMRTKTQREKVRHTLNFTVKPMFVPEQGRDAHNVVIVMPRGAAKTTIVQGFIEWSIGRASLGYPVSHGFTVAATRWAWDDAVDWAIEEQGWEYIIRKAIVTDGEGNEHSYWPERFDLAYLQKERQLDPRSFAQQYQNEVAPEEGLTFERWWFQRRFDALPSDIALRFEAWDLASSRGRKSDYSVGLAFVVARACPMCQGAPYHAFIPHMFRGKLTYGYLKPAMRDVYDLMGGYSSDHYIVVEKKSSGEALEGEGLHESAVPARESRYYPMHFRSALGEGQALGMRDEYLRVVADLCRQGRVHLPSDEFLRQRSQGGDWMPDFEQELFSFPEGNKDDIVFALAHGVLEMEERMREHQRLLMRPRDPVPWAKLRERRQIA